MEENKQGKSRFWLSLLAGFLISLALCAVGTLVFSSRIPEKTASAGIYICACLLTAWYLVSQCCQIRLLKRSQDRRQILDKLSAIRDGGVEALDEVKRRLDRMCRISDLTAAVLAALSLGMSLFLYAEPGCGIIPVGILGLLIQRYGPRKQKTQEFPWAQESDYPQLYALAEKAQRALGGSRPIRIAIWTDCNAAVFCHKKEARLVLGAILIASFSQEELYQILLHEFAHLKDEEQLRYQRRMEGLDFPNPLFSLTDERMEEAYSYYQVFSSRTQEERADRAILELGDPRTAANAFAKLWCNEQYENDFLSSGEEMAFYSGETPPDNWISHLRQDFQLAVERNGIHIRELLWKELRPRVSSHPIARDRIEALGIRDFSLTFPKWEGSWGQECRSALAWADQLYLQWLKEDYSAQREEYYLKPRRVLESWESAGKPISHEATREVVEAMYRLEQYDRILTLSEAFAASGASESERCHVLFHEGLARLKLSDQGGLDLLYRAVELNRNYLHSAFEVISRYCAALGLEEEMERFREISENSQDAYLDHMDIFPLSPKDLLEVSDLDPARKEENLAVLRSVCDDALESAYLVKKTVSQRSVYHIYILKFREGTAGEDQEKIYDQIFVHLDKQEESYALSLWETDCQWLEKRPEYKII